MNDEYKKIIINVIENGIWYFNRLGQVNHLSYPNVDSSHIRGNKGSTHMNFSWSDLNKKFYLTEKEAQEKAQEYIDNFSKYISLKTLKKICKLKENDIFYEKTEIFGVISCSIDNCYYDKYELALIVLAEYDDDFGGGYKVYTYPLSQYGKTWALTKEEISND